MTAADYKVTRLNEYDIKQHGHRLGRGPMRAETFRPAQTITGYGSQMTNDCLGRKRWRQQMKKANSDKCGKSGESGEVADVDKNVDD